jgi:hypothetical protein
LNHRPKEDHCGRTCVQKHVDHAIRAGRIFLKPYLDLEIHQVRDGEVPEANRKRFPEPTSAQA